MTAGVFIGATIHDVAQVVGAGFSISDRAGEVATLVKLIRVAMLAPVIVFLSFAIRRQAGGAGEARAPLLPLFVVGFLVCALLNSAGLVPVALQQLAASTSQWCLLVAIAAVGIKTSLKSIFIVGGTAIVLMVLETAFIATLVLGVLML